MTISLISTVTLATSTSSINFTGIAGTATDLMVTASLRMSSGNAYLGVRFNSVSTGYSYRSLSGNGSASSSTTSAGGTDAIKTGVTTIPGATSTFGNATIYIPNYAGSAQKTVSLDSVGEDNATTAYQDLTAGLWPDTAAITSVTVFHPAGLQANSTVSLYAITKGSGGASVA
jgi:hypothetical protein